MSIKSFFESVGSEIEKLFKSVVSSSWEQKASATIKYVAPLVETIVQLAAGTAAAAAVTGVINQVQADLAAGVSGGSGRESGGGHFRRQRCRRRSPA